MTITLGISVMGIPLVLIINNPINHTYMKVGTYSVILKVEYTDGSEKTIVKENYITVSSRINCPLAATLESQKDVDVLRNTRDAFLFNFSGIILTSIYYRNADEVTSILSTNAQLKDKLRYLVKENMGLIPKLIQGESVIVSEDVITSINEFLIELKQEGSPKLQVDIDFVIKGIGDRYLLKGIGVSVE